MISVLLPTIRPHLFRRSFDSIAPAADGVPYEVIVVADFDSDVLDCRAPTQHLHCRWIVRARKGVIDAIAAAATVANGDYFFVFNDESVLEPGALKVLYEAAQRTPNHLLSPKHVPAFPFVYYGLPFAAFPFVHRDVVNQLGGLFDPAYRGFYADPDLSLRAHAAGVPIRVVEEAVIRHTNKHDAAHQASVGAYFAADQALFRSRWDHLGEFRDP